MEKVLQKRAVENKNRLDSTSMRRWYLYFQSTGIVFESSNKRLEAEEQGCENFTPEQTQELQKQYAAALKSSRKFEEDSQTRFMADLAVQTKGRSI